MPMYNNVIFRLVTVSVDFIKCFPNIESYFTFDTPLGIGVWNILTENPKYDIISLENAY